MLHTHTHTTTTNGERNFLKETNRQSKDMRYTRTSYILFQVKLLSANLFMRKLLRSTVHAYAYPELCNGSV